MPFSSPILAGAIFWTLLAAAVTITLIALARAGRRRTYRRIWHEEWRRHRESLQHGSVLLALDVRYARGEIGRDDYLQSRADLFGRPPLTAPPSAPAERTATALAPGVR